MMNEFYTPPYTVTPSMMQPVGEIGEWIGRFAVTSDQETDHVSDQVLRLLDVLRDGETRATDLMASLNLSHRPTFRKNYLEPALDADLIARTQPHSPRSPTQRYMLTEKGRTVLAKKTEKPSK